MCIGEDGLSNRGSWVGAAQLTIGSGHEVLPDRYRCDSESSELLWYFPLNSTLLRGDPGARLVFEGLPALLLWERRV